MEGYHQFCLAEGKRPTTIQWYTGKLRVFQRYLADNGISTDAADMTTTRPRAFLGHLRENVNDDRHYPGEPTRDISLSAMTTQGCAWMLKVFFS